MFDQGLKAMKVLFISAEAIPFAKTGGLADVAGSLPAALKRLGIDVFMGLPFYRFVREGNFALRLLMDNLKVPFGAGELVARVWSINITSYPATKATGLTRPILLPFTAKCRPEQDL